MPLCKILFLTLKQAFFPPASVSHLTVHAGVSVEVSATGSVESLLSDLLRQQEKRDLYTQISMSTTVKMKTNGERIRDSSGNSGNHGIRRGMIQHDRNASVSNSRGSWRARVRFPWYLTRFCGRLRLIALRLTSQSVMRVV